MRWMLVWAALVLASLPMGGSTSPSPTASFGEEGHREVITVGPDWFQNQFSWQSLPRDVRAGLDADGDRNVSREEESAGRLFIEGLAIPASCAAGFTYARIGDHAPLTLSIGRNLWARGPVDQEQPPRENWRFQLDYPAAAKGGEIVLRLGDIAQVDELVECAGGPDVPLFEGWRLPSFATITGSEDAWIQPKSVHPVGLRQPMDLSGITELGVTNGTWDSSKNNYYETNHIGMGGVELAEAYAGEVRLRLGPRPPEFPWLAVAAATTTAVMLGFGLSEFGRFRLRGAWLGLLLFTRLRRELALENPTRDAIVTFVSENPGATFGQIRSHVGTGHGNLVHHLRVLEHQRIVRAHRDGFRCRVFPVGIPVPSVSAAHPAQRTILELLRSEPGLTQSVLAGRLSIPRRTVSYHLGQLELMGALRWQRTAGKKRYYARQNDSPSRG